MLYLHSNVSFLFCKAHYKLTLRVYLVCKEIYRSLSTSYSLCTESQSCLHINIMSAAANRLSQHAALTLIC